MNKRSLAPGDSVFVKYTSDAANWVNDLWLAAEEQARDLPGDKVVILLREAGGEVWDAGIDALFHKRGESLSIERAHVFDITWLSVFAAKLARFRQRRGEE